MAQDLDARSILASTDSLPAITKKIAPRPADRAAILAMRALKPRHRRIVRAELDPENIGKALEIKAALAGVTRATYRRALTRQDVQDAMTTALRRMLAPLIPAVLAAAARSAALDGREGYQDRKLLLSMAGIATEAAKKVEHSGSVTVKHGVGGALERALLRRQEAQEVENAIEPAIGGVLPRAPIINATAIEDDPESDTLTFED